MIKKIIKHRFFDLILITVIGLLSITWFRGDFIIKSGDSFLSLSPINQLAMYSYVWNHVFSTGVPNSGSISMIPYGSLMAFLSYFGVSISASEKILFYFLFTSSGLGMYYLFYTLLPKHRLASLVSGLFYMMNPFGLTNVWGSGPITIVFAYTLFPWIFAFFIKGLESKRIKYLLIIVLLWVFFSTSSANPAFVIPIVGMCFSYLIFHLIVNRSDKQVIIYSIKFVFLLILLMGLSNLWWILPTLPFIKERLVSAGVSGSPINIFLGTSKHTSLLNVFRALGAWTLYVKNFPDSYFSWSGTYFTIPFVILSFLPPILAFSAILLKKSKYVIYFTAMSILILLFLEGAHPPFTSINLWLFNNIPFASVFRAHYQKLGMTLVLSYAFLIGISLERIYYLIKDKVLAAEKRRGTLTSIALIITILLLMEVIYVFPFWTGDVIYGGGAVIPSYRIQVPTYYYNASDWFNNQNKDFRILYLPGLSSLGPAYSWKHGYFGSDPLDEYFFRGVGIIHVDLTGNNMVDDFQRQIVKSFSKNTSISLGKVLALANVHYILLHNDFDLRYSHTISPEYYENILNYQKGIYLEKSFGKLDFYRNDYWQPLHFYAISSAILVNGGINEIFQIVTSDNLVVGKSMFFLSDQLNPVQVRFITQYNSTIIIFISKGTINIPVYDGLNEPFSWSLLEKGSYAARSYSGWKSVIRTDGKEAEDTLSFPSLKACPYKFQSVKSTSWSAFNSTLVYIKTGNKPLRIASILGNGKPVNDIAGVWWETGWVGMGTKPVEFPVVIPSHQRAIIQVNHKTENLSIATIGKLENLSKLKNMKENNRPLIIFKRVNPTKYIVNVENATKPFFLVFSESYNPGWKIYSMNKNTALEKVIAKYPDVNVEEAKNSWYKFTPQDVVYLLRKPAINESYHFKANGYANAWYINPEKINKDGSGNFTLTIYFRPQSYFYLGLFISLITFILSLGYLFYDWRRVYYEN